MVRARMCELQMTTLNAGCWTYLYLDLRRLQSGRYSSHAPIDHTRTAQVVDRSSSLMRGQRTTTPIYIKRTQRNWSLPVFRSGLNKLVRQRLFILPSVAMCSTYGYQLTAQTYTLSDMTRGFFRSLVCPTQVDEKTVFCCLQWPLNVIEKSGPRLPGVF